MNGENSGSGCLIGPSLVLTAWHVVRPACAEKPEPQSASIEIRLSDDTTQKGRIAYFSPCSDLELQQQFPTDDESFNGRNDVALIKLERPFGTRLGYPRLPKHCSKLKGRSPILLIHYPQGIDLKGYSPGRIDRIRGITARFLHDVDNTDHGSSGGPCFTVELELAGLHQGKLGRSRRLVPIMRFLDDIRPRVESDIAPLTLWSLDGTPEGVLVINRDLFFEGIAAATRPASRMRGVRVKRRDPKDPPTGLAFSFDILQDVLLRNSQAHRWLRVNLEPPYRNLLARIRSAAAASGAVDVAANTSADDDVPKLAAALNAAAERENRLYWFFFDQPGEILTEVDYVPFESFVAAALQQPRLRLVLAGFESFSTPAQEFSSAGQAEGDGPPGMLIEWIGLFNRGNIEDLLRRACADMGVSVPSEVIQDRANEALQGITSFNNQYSTKDLEPITENIVGSPGTELEFAL